MSNKKITFTCVSCDRQGKRERHEEHTQCFNCRRKVYTRGGFTFWDNVITTDEIVYDDENPDGVQYQYIPCEYDQKCASCDTHIFYNYRLNNEKNPVPIGANNITEYNPICSMCISKLNDV